MTSEMIERVGRAMKALRLLEYDDQDTMDNLARAAIEAMREPTEAMIRAAYEWTEVDLDLIPETWTAMIDSALEPASPTGREEA